MREIATQEDIPYGAMQTVREFPDWAQVRPPDIAMFGSGIQRRFAQIMFPIRAVLIGALWLTVYWYRVAAVLIIAATIVAIVLKGS